MHKRSVFISPLLILSLYKLNQTVLITVSPRAIEHARCTFADVREPLHDECPRYDCKFHLMVRLRFGSFKKYGLQLHCGGAHGVMVIVVGNGHGDTSSNPGRD